MAESENPGVLFTGDLTVRVRLDGQVRDYDLTQDNDLPMELEALILTIRERYGYLYA